MLGRASGFHSIQPKPGTEADRKFFEWKHHSRLAVGWVEACKMDRNSGFEEDATKGKSRWRELSQMGDQSSIQTKRIIQDKSQVDGGVGKVGARRDGTNVCGVVLFVVE